MSGLEIRAKAFGGADRVRDVRPPTITAWTA
jgi:hypothetical protein